MPPRAKKSRDELRQEVLTALQNAQDGETSPNEPVDQVDDRAVSQIMPMVHEGLIVPEVRAQAEGAPVLVYRLQGV